MATTTASTLRETRTTVFGMEYSIHGASATHKSEVQAIFPDLDISDMLIVPTCQRSVLDLVKTGEDVEAEKDYCLERFAEWSGKVCQSLKDRGHWADFIDPCSGLPMLNRHYQRPYSEVDGFSTLLRYPTQNCGCCKIILHPKWGSSIYPATLFAKAPLNVLEATLLELESHQPSQ